MGLSTHQGFVTPDREKRRFNIDRTIAQIEIAYDLGIPVIRVNTGTWGTSKDFDELMAMSSSKSFEVPQVPVLTRITGMPRS